MDKFPDRDQLETLQLGKLRALLQEIVPANRFYARKLGHLDLRSSASNLSEFSRAIPFTTRHELVRDRLEHPPYGTGLTYPRDAYVRCHQTSGTTTMPIRWLDTRESWSQIVANWTQIFNAACVTPQDRFFFAFSFGPFLGFWSALDAVLQLGCFCFPGGSMTSLARLQAILDNDITVLCCTPTYAQHLGQVAREKNVDLARSKLRLIIVAGEGGGSIPATRKAIESLWPGASVFDHHGMTEVGPVSYQCPAHPGTLHIIESAYRAEIVDPKTGASIRPGEAGELVLTTLDRLGSPLVRYRTGDLVRPVEDSRCSCGRYQRALTGGILGRADDMVVVRGVNVYPSLIEEIVRAYPEMVEYRVELDCRNAMTELVLEVEASVSGAAATGLASRIERSLQTALNLRVPVRLLPAGALPRFEMKAQRWTRLTA